MGQNVRVLRGDRLGGLIQEYAQVAMGDRIFGTHRVGWGWIAAHSYWRVTNQSYIFKECQE